MQKAKYLFLSALLAMAAPLFADYSSPVAAVAGHKAPEVQEKLSDGDLARNLISMDNLDFLKYEQDVQKLVATLGEDVIKEWISYLKHLRSAFPKARDAVQPVHPNDNELQASSDHYMDSLKREAETTAML